MTPRPVRRLVVIGLAAAAARVTADAVRRSHPGGAQRWLRANYRGRDVDLSGGPGAAAGLLAGLAAGGAPGAVAAAAAAAGLGLYDDLAGHTHARGLRGHVAALRRGTVTTGAVKMLGLVAAGCVTGPTRPRRPAGVGLDVVLVAGSANLVNLLDLRPGRALKATLAVGVPLTVTRGEAGDVAGLVVGTAIALLPEDLAEQQMLGDCGANALGAAIGWSLARRLGARGRVAAAGLVVGLTLVSEKVSFSKLIEQRPMLRAIDSWGRRTP